MQSTYLLPCKAAAAAAASRELVRLQEEQVNANCYLCVVMKQGKGEGNWPADLLTT
jgi:hypothetical protein